MTLNKWEDKVRIIGKEFDETVKDPIKIAIVVNMMPMDIQEYVYANLAKGAKYTDVVYKIRVLAGNKAAMTSGGPVPMDIGDIGGKNVAAEECETCGEDEYVNAVGYNAQCFNCQGWGHAKRDCPSQLKGKGKGYGYKGQSKGGGKGYQKGGFSPAGKSGFSGGTGGSFGNGGKGGGYQGKCFNCGLIGHKKWECRKPVATNAVEETGAEEQDIADCWWIEEVRAHNEEEAQLFREVSKRQRVPEAKVKNTEFQTILHNRFEAIEEEVEVPIMTCEATAEKMTRASAMRFNEADVRKPLASAVSVAKAGNRIVVDGDGGYIENKATGDRMKVRVEQNTFVYDVQLEDGALVTVTFDSGAGCHVWPRGLSTGGARLLPKQVGMRMRAANGTDISYYGQRFVKFRGMETEKTNDSGFPMQR